MKTVPEHLAPLRRFQAWRLGDDELEQPDPREITAALDWAIAVLSEGERGIPCPACNPPDAMPS